MKKLLLLPIGAVVLWSVWFYQPDRQLERRHRKLITAVESRNWKKLSAMTTDDFHAGLYDKAEAFETGKELFRPFFSVQLTEHDKTRNGNVITSLIRMEGKGAAFANEIVLLINQQKEPVVFTWRRMSWKPWDWKLFNAEHPLFHTSANF